MGKDITDSKNVAAQKYLSQKPKSTGLYLILNTVFSATSEHSDNDMTIRVSRQKNLSSVVRKLLFTLPCIF